MEIENCNRSLKYFVAFPHCYPPKKPSRCALEKIHVPLEAIRFQPARFHTRSFGFGHFQNRYTRSDAGTLSGPLEPTVTRMLIVRYYLCSSFKEGYGSGVDFLKNGNIRGIFAFLSWLWPFRNLIEAAELA
jgi:hypothetical protein